MQIKIICVTAVCSTLFTTLEIRLGKIFRMKITSSLISFGHLKHSLTTKNYVIVTYIKI